MRAGSLDRFIHIQVGTEGQDAHGQPTYAWSNLVSRRRASYTPLTGEERFTGDQFEAQEQAAFVVRQSAKLEGLSAMNRVIYPVRDDGSVREGDIWNIMAVLEVGGGEGWKIMAYRVVNRR